MIFKKKETNGKTKQSELSTLHKNLFETPVEEIQRKYYEETANKIIFTCNSLFTEKFTLELKKILQGEISAGKSFKRKKKLDKIRVVKKLDDLLETESLWKDLIKSSKYNSAKIASIFPTELEQFNTIFNDKFYPPEKITKRSKVKYGSERCKLYFKGLLEYLQHNTEAILNKEGMQLVLSEKDHQELITFIDPSFLFKELVKISMKKAYDTNINIQNINPNSFLSKPLDTNFLKAKRTDLQYSLTSYLSIYLANVLLNYLSTREKGCLRQNDSEHIIKSLKYMQSLFKQERLSHCFETDTPWFFETSQISMILLVLFQETDVIKFVFKEKSTKLNREHIIFVFDHKLDNSIAFSHNLPRIIPPLKADSEKGILDWVLPVKEGRHNIQISKNALKSLNNAQKKEFVVSSKFKKLLEQVDANRDHVDEFTTKKQFENKKKELEAWSESPWNNTLKVTLYKVTRRTLSLKRSKKEGLHTKVAFLSGMTALECYANAAKNTTRNSLVTMRSSRQLLLTSLDISDIYTGYPLYYGTVLDFRLRMYPLQYLLSRTTGYLKNLLEESVSRKVTEVGLNNMLQAYYSPDPRLLKKFNMSKKKEIHSYTSMGEFFKQNKIELNKSPLYFELLQIEISDLLKSSTKKSSLQLEIDQVGSGPTIIALLTRNRKLAEKCNLLNGPFCCIYTFLLEKSVPFLLENISQINRESKVFKLLTTNRKAQKYALMCFFYNEQHLGRTRRWAELYEEVYLTTVPSEDFEIISQFSVLYPKFMDYVFPKLMRQLEILNEAALIVVKQQLPVKINTLDNCIIAWDFDHSKQIKKNYFNPISGTHDQYKINVKVKSPTNKSTRSRNSRHRLSFRPNLIHSIDASMMRIFLCKFYEQTGRRLNHLHDCVMLHPNDVNIFYQIVSQVYCNPSMNTLADDLVFSRMELDLVGEPLENILKLKKEFTKNMDDFELTPPKFDPKKCYRYEGAK